MDYRLAIHVMLFSPWLVMALLVVLGLIAFIIMSSLKLFLSRKVYNQLNNRADHFIHKTIEDLVPYGCFTGVLEILYIIYEVTRG
jgi:hypothetical protein